MRLALTVIGAALVAGVAFFVPRVRADEPSFDCKKARTEIERAICNSPDLSKLDADLAQIYDLLRHATYVGRDALEHQERSWLADRNQECEAPEASTAPAYQESFVGCLKAAYQTRIEELKLMASAQKIDVGPSATYGILTYHFDSKHRGLDDQGPQLSAKYAAKLLDALRHQEGPVKTKIDGIIAAHCGGDNDPDCGAGLSKPNDRNTVALAFGSGGASGGGGLFRSFLTWTEGGSGHFTRPVLALDFEMDIENRSMESNEVESDLTVRLTGMEDFTDDRLRHVEGLPDPKGCFGCE